VIRDHAQSLGLDYFGTSIDRELREHNEREIVRALVYWPTECLDLLEREVTRGMTPAPDPADFEYTRHRLVFAALLDLREQRQPLTADRILASARKGSDAPDFDAWFRHLVLDPERPVLDPPSVTHWLDGLRAAAEDRLVRNAVATANPETVRTVLDEIDARERVSIKPSARREDVIGRVVSAIRQPGKANGTRLPWRIHRIDMTGNAITEGEFVLLAGRPGSGKSTWALRWAVETSVATARPILYVTFEMGTDACWKKCLHAQAGVPDRMGAPYPPEEMRKLEEAAAFLKARCRLDIKDDLNQRIVPFEAYVRKVIRDDHPAVVVVDYLGQIEGRGNREYESLTDVSRTLRAIAQQTKVPMLALHQFNRSSVGERRPPELHDLRGTGQLEQDGSQIVLLDRVWDRMSDKERDQEPQAENIVRFNLRKSRFGRPASETMRLDGARSLLLPVQPGS